MWIKRLVVPAALFLIYLVIALGVGFAILWLLPQLGGPDLGLQTKTTDVAAPGGTTTTTETNDSTKKTTVLVAPDGTTTTTTETNESTTNPGKQTKTTEVVAPGGATTTTETTTSTPLLIVAVALAGGGWLLIPLKYAWDEATKDSQAERDELADEADDRRKIADKMRDEVHEGITSHWGPILYAQRDVERWAERCANAVPPVSTPFMRLFYSVALLEERYQHLSEEGRPLLLRSLNLEGLATKRSDELKEFMYSLLGDSEDAVAEVVNAVRWVPGAPVTDQSATREHASFAEFLRRIQGDNPNWKDFRDVYNDFHEQCMLPGQIDNLSEKAKKAQESLAKGLNDVYRDWYRPELD